MKKQITVAKVVCDLLEFHANMAHKSRLIIDYTPGDGPMRPHVSITLEGVPPCCASRTVFLSGDELVRVGGLFPSPAAKTMAMDIYAELTSPVL